MSMRRIAQLAGVSKSTVSLVFANSPTIPDATKRRVLRIARQLGYRRDAKLTELMSRLRLSRSPERAACFGVISFYDSVRPWANSEHHKRIYQAMTRRADALGYRLEPLWLREPGMTLRRFRSVLDTRGIEGLLCFGSPRFDEAFPSELNRYAIVNLGLSIKASLHRVINHAYDDTWRALTEVRNRGYRKPGLVLSYYEDERSGYARSSAYLGWFERVLGRPADIPVLRMNQMEEARARAWLEQHSPDVVVVVHSVDVIREFVALLERLGLHVPRHVGVAAISQVLRGSGFSGLEENQRLMGEWAVELLIARIVNRDLGVPAHPRIETVPGLWVEGGTLASAGG